jgi:hypothetical protein
MDYYPLTTLHIPLSGFKCVFDKGILQLFFNFRRYRYRR